ncbi:indolepyruvate ferredoxin oxidoreductase subunit alpha [Eubacteriales bacterium OttesenSCG-928-M02]|nr:indolepyruvate ferredoxin oxidoreductase subunit alpha [Eubacteriales bacterium OttesenSCG-928-M02]
MKELLLGNEAIARGAKDAGVGVVSSYPGTPSTEVTETIAALGGVYAEWAANEKVAAEVAMGAAVTGARAMCCMKHVGLNVASEVLFTGAYTGVNGGLVFVVADDPAMHSSQNEQDTRYYAMAAHVPILEPSDAQEAYDFTRLAFLLSESCDIPVIVRMTTRIAHTRGLVQRREGEQPALLGYEKRPEKYVMMPNNARPRKHALMENLERVKAFAREHNINRVEEGDSAGFVCAGGVYQYVKEARPNASILKLGMPYPLLEEEVKAFCRGKAPLYVVEELEPVLEMQLNTLGLFPEGKEIFSKYGEYSTKSIQMALDGEMDTMAEASQLPNRPPVLCPGCPHRSVYSVVKKLGLTAFGDIGCYTLGANPPLGALDTTICMGASIGMAHGAALARGEDFAQKSIAVIGDSTFFHSGLDGLASAVYNNSNVTVLVLDNGTTGMTGHQENPSTGKTLLGDPAGKLSIEGIGTAMGIQTIHVVDALVPSAVEAALKDALTQKGVSLVVARHDCALIEKPQAPLQVDAETCILCGMCLGTGCPALLRGENSVEINTSMCRGCKLCASVCPVNAIGEGK